MGSRNHTLVPVSLISQIAGLRSGGSVHKSISALAKAGLIAKMKNAKYDGYRLTYGGLDYLALNTLRKGKWVYSVGNQIGVGKESDIYVVANETGKNCVLKIHRLGRISFRTVKANRDYLRNRSSGSWMYMSRLAAMKEFAFMRALRETGFRVPEPLAQNRHTVLMEFVDALPLRQISEVPDPAGLYDELMEMILNLAEVGLIHGDFNEFNILMKEERASETESQEEQPQDSNHTASETKQFASSNSGATKLTPILIDFPQMLSVDHPNAASYFDRDVACVKRFFERRFGFASDEPGPYLADAVKAIGKGIGKRLDVEVEATGFSRKMAKELEVYMKEVGVVGDGDAADPSVADDAEDAREDIEDQPEASDANRTPPEMNESGLSPNSDFSHEAVEVNLDGLDLKDTEYGEFEAWHDPVKPAPNLRATKKAAGWAI